MGSKIASSNAARDSPEPPRKYSSHPARGGLAATLRKLLGTLVPQNQLRALVPAVGSGVLALTILLAFAAQAAQAADKLAICYGHASSALVPLAKLRDFYAAEGLDVEVRRLPSGLQALEAMFAGECALATVAEIPVAHYSLSRNDFRIVAAISAYSNIERIIVRSDRGILVPADLRGRRVAVPEFTIAHYFVSVQPS